MVQLVYIQSIYNQSLVLCRSVVAGDSEDPVVCLPPIHRPRLRHGHGVSSVWLEHCRLQLESPPPQSQDGHPQQRSVSVKPGGGPSVMDFLEGKVERGSLSVTATFDGAGLNNDDTNCFESDAGLSPEESVSCEPPQFMVTPGMGELAGRREDATCGCDSERLPASSLRTKATGEREELEEKKNEERLRIEATEERKEMEKENEEREEEEEEEEEEVIQHPLSSPSKGTTRNNNDRIKPTALSTKK